MGFRAFNNAQFPMDKASRIPSTLIFMEVHGITLIIPLNMPVAYSVL